MQSDKWIYVYVLQSYKLVHVLGIVMGCPCGINLWKD